jgi:hypothetical protein
MRKQVSSPSPEHENVSGHGFQPCRKRVGASAPSGPAGPTLRLSADALLFITPVPSAPPILLALLLPTSDPKNTRDKCPQTKGSPAAGLFRCTCTERRSPCRTQPPPPPNRQIGSPPDRPSQCCRVCKPNHEPENRALTACTPPGKTNSAPETKLSEATDSPPGEAFNSRKRMD